MTTGYDDETIQENVDTYGPMSTMLFLVHTLVPLLLLLLAVVLIVVMVLRGRRHQARH